MQSVANIGGVMKYLEFRCIAARIRKEHGCLFTGFFLKPNSEACNEFPPVLVIFGRIMPFLRIRNDTEVSETPLF